MPHGVTASITIEAGSSPAMLQGKQQPKIVHVEQGRDYTTICSLFQT